MNSTRRYIVGVLVLLALNGCGASHSALVPEPMHVEGMSNAAAVGNLLIGGQPSAEALDSLAGMGYRTVLSVRSENEIEWDEQLAVEAAGMSFRRIEMTNPVNEITDEQVARFDEFMNGLDGKAVLHCGSGNRIAGLWAAWLIDYRDIEPQEAIRVAKAAGMRDSIGAAVERRVNAR